MKPNQRDQIRQRMQGFESRQAIRTMTRKAGNTVQRLRIARNKGLLEQLPAASAYLKERQIDFHQSTMYRVTMLDIRIGKGMQLYYDPTGKISYLRSRRETIRETHEQQQLFT